MGANASRRSPDSGRGPRADAADADIGGAASPQAAATTTGDAPGSPRASGRERATRTERGDGAPASARAGGPRGDAPGSKDDVQAVLDGIRRIVHGLHASSRAAEQHVGLTGAQLFVLRRLADAGPLSVNDLARRTFTHQSSVSTVVARLQTRRFIRRGVDAKDRRKRILALTAAGHRALAAAPDAAQEDLIDGVRALPAGTRRTLALALGRIADAMAAARRPGMFFEPRARRA